MGVGSGAQPTPDYAPHTQPNTKDARITQRAACPKWEIPSVMPRKVLGGCNETLRERQETAQR
jgi:hypothetical protein